ELGDRSYPILIGRRLIDTIGTHLREVCDGDQIMLVWDRAVESPWGKLLFKTIAGAGFDVGTFEVPEGESSKSAEMLARLWDTLADGAFGRDSMIVALGGGVVGDLAGFAAASYLRGIAFAQIPTTLLAMVDSSVGGKTGINLPQGKNLIGAFWQPRLVVADLDCLGTLADAERNSGMAEVIKYGVIHDAAFFAFLEEHAAALFLPDGTEHLVHAVKRSVEIKAEVVTADERESGLRAILNFGHTLGHALEAEGHYHGLRHGEAISVGMAAASLLAVRRGGMWTAAEDARLTALLQKVQLPVRFPAGTEAHALIERTYLDKKARQGRPRYVLPVRMGEVELVRDVTDAEVMAVVKELGAK
ncbi:3-dehydroquinate synthase, partial [Candidatus Poribacteria bacterium]|nr:3-dehydroquinate synthase [Candidatus Poribacteria bacterium]